MIRTGELTEMVLKHYGAPEGSTSGKYISLTQVRAATGWADPSTADVMIMGNWPSSGCLLEGFEVKISRSDWLNEVKSPGKATPTKKYCNKWWLVIADESFVKEGELPSDWGMMVPHQGKLKIVKRAPLLQPEPLTNLFVASLLRADKKDMIPVDVHNDRIKDAVRDAEAACKHKYSELLDYVKFLNREFGIDLKQDYRKQWVAKVKNTYHELSAEEAVKLIRAALESDLERMNKEMRYLRSQATRIIEAAEAVIGNK